jgi:aspartate racemase
MENKTSLLVGVLGGMGPEATVDFMSKVIALTPGDDDQDHVRLLVDQNPQVPNRQEALLRGGENPGPVLADMARGLEAGGCEFLVMPCNTAHAFQDDIRSAVDIPFISIVDVTLDATGDATCVGIMATTACVQANVYQPVLESRGMRFLLPSDEDTAELTRLSFEIKSGNKGDEIKVAVRRFANALVEHGADVIVSACTEFPLVFGSDDLDVPLLSSTDELAKRTIALARGDMPLPNL